MSRKQVVYRVTGSDRETVRRAVSRLHDLHLQQGQVVLKYINPPASVEENLRQDADVIIIVQEPKT